MTVDLVTFLRARLDEDERVAQSAGGQRWSRLGELPWVNTERTERWQPPGSDHHVANVPLDSDRDHIVRWDPERVLAEVDAKRRLVNASAADCAPGCIPDHTFSGSCALRWMGPAWEEGGARWVHDVAGATAPAPPVTTDYALRLLALPYRDHPDYQPEWAPEES